MTVSELNALSREPKRTKGLKTIDKIIFKIVSTYSDIISNKLDGNEDGIKSAVGTLLVDVSILTGLNERKHQIVFDETIYEYGLELSDDIKPEDIPDVFDNLLDIVAMAQGHITRAFIKGEFDTINEEIKNIVTALTTMCVLLDTQVEELWEEALREGE